MARFRPAVCLAFAALAMSGAGEVEARLKKVPVDGSAKVLSPAQMEVKRAKLTKAEKIELKRARIAAKKARKATVLNEPVVAVRRASADDDAPMQPELKLIPLRIDADGNRISGASEQPVQLPADQIVPGTPNSDLSKIRVYDLSASAPTQVEITKLKKTRTKKSKDDDLPQAAEAAKAKASGK